MPYNEKLADKIRGALIGTRNLVEEKMFGGIAFMVKDRMSIGVNRPPELHLINSQINFLPLPDLSSFSRFIASTFVLKISEWINTQGLYRTVYPFGGKMIMGQ